MAVNSFADEVHDSVEGDHDEESDRAPEDMTPTSLARFIALGMTNHLEDAVEEDEHRHREAVGSERCIFLMKIAGNLAFLFTL